jgi:uncharacterized lipoprotein YmbA
MLTGAALRFAAPFVGLIVLGVVSCTGTSKPAQFYLMQPMDSAAVTNAPIDRPIRIGVGPVTLREHLKRPQIVIRMAGAQIKLSEFHRWAESLEENFIQVLTENLILLLGTEEVFVYPWSGMLQLDYRIELSIHRFDVEQGKGAQLNVRWTIFDADKDSVLVNRRNVFTRALTSSAYEDVVDAQSALLADLSRQIAEDIEKLHSKR